MTAALADRMCPDTSSTAPTQQPAPVPAVPGRASEVLSAATARLTGASLAEVVSTAGLQTRTEHKYLLTAAELALLLSGAPEQFLALEIDARRSFGYESVYFDTPDRRLFRDHRQGRRRRFKARTRTYTDSGECMFEVKTKGRRGQTVKHRMPYEAADRAHLLPVARAFLDQVLAADYGVAAPDLVPALRSTYRRSTLVDPVSGSRLTFDVGLGWHDLVPGSGAVDDRLLRGPDLVVVESKSADGQAPADRALAAMGLRPQSMSKYCIGTALADPQLPANPWNQVLRRHFGWRRETQAQR